MPYTLQFFLFVSSVSQTLMWTAFWLIICPYLHQCVLCTSENQSLIFVGKGYKIQIWKKSIQWNFSFGTPLFKGHLHAGDTNFDPGKMWHIIFVTSIEAWTLFLGPETQTPFSDTLVLKKHHKFADKFKIKCALVTMATTHELSNLNWYTALVVIQHTTSQGQVNHDFLYSHYLAAWNYWLQQIPR